MPEFVLVHGAYHGAWCWIKLKAELERRGHCVHALDMPGCGEDRTPLADVTLEAYTDRIVATLRDTTREPVTLVGHSLGTVSVSLAAEREPQRISDLVFLAGATPRSGMSIYSLLQLLDAPNQPAPAEPPPGHPWLGICQDVPLDQVKALFYNDCSDADVEYARSHLRPQTNAPRVTPVNLTTSRYGAVRRTVINCSLDNAHTVARQAATLALDPSDRVHTMATGHSPFFSAPTQLADLLCNL
jgi:pimeloyl-ACP methyl ester carboxylesterase